METPLTALETHTGTTGIIRTCNIALPARRYYFILSLLCGSLLFLCHFPVAWGWLGWVALVPLLPLIRAEISGRWRYFCAWLAGSAFFWPVISWMTVADYRMVACWAMLSWYCSLYFPLAILFVRRLDRSTGLPLLVTFPIVWTALEFLRSFAFTGFAWYLLGHTQQDVPPVIQIADLGGAFIVSFVVAAVNVVIFEALLQVPAISRWLRVSRQESNGYCQGIAWQLGCVALMVSGTIGYGIWRLSNDECETGPRIAMLQGSIDQRLRIEATRSAQANEQVMAVYQDLCVQAAKLDPRPQLIIWPETSYPNRWFTTAPRVDVANQSLTFQRELASLQESVLVIGPIAKTSVLLGINTDVLDFDKKSKRFNSALLVDSRGLPIGRYDKIHRVPFGEYVPLRDWLPFMNALAPYDFEYSISQGHGLTRMPLGQHKFGVLVCYEDTDPAMARDYSIRTADGDPVDFLVNISNDGWFDGSAQHEEHLAISRFRAIEARRSVVRAVNMGISAVIDSSGRVLAPTKRKEPDSGPREVWEVSKNAGRLSPSKWQQYKQSEGILVVDIPIDRRTSIYATWGDWLPYGCWALIGIGFAWGCVQWFMKKMRRA